MAKRIGGPTVVMTFDPHPSTILYPQTAVSPLTTSARRIELLRQLGVDHVLVCPTSRELLSLSAEEFFTEVICDRVAAKGLIEGPNFFFGRGRGGNVELLAAMCQGRGLAFEIADAACDAEEMISSSRIRELIRSGDIDGANQLLTASYQVSGTVVGGEQRGRKLGFPTANLGDVPVLVPGPGVYATRATWSGGTRIAATHIGPNPTFDQPIQKLEVHLLDFAGDLYGETLTVDFIARVRDIARFASPEALREQLQRDIQQTRSLATGR